MRRLSTALMLAVAARPSASGAQTADPLAPLERYIGTWVYEGDGNGARVSCRSERRWMTNQSFVESHRECVTGSRPITQVDIYGFDPRRRLYVYWGFDGRVPSTYTADRMDLAVAWTGEQASSTARCTETYAADFQSSVSQCEVSSDLGKTWQRGSGGTSKKVQ